MRLNCDDLLLVAPWERAAVFLALQLLKYNIRLQNPLTFILCSLTQETVFFEILRSCTPNSAILQIIPSALYTTRGGWENEINSFEVVKVLLGHLLLLKKFATS